MRGVGEAEVAVGRVVRVAVSAQNPGVGRVGAGARGGGGVPDPAETTAVVVGESVVADLGRDALLRARRARRAGLRAVEHEVPLLERGYKNRFTNFQEREMTNFLRTNSNSEENNEEVN